MSVNAVNFMIPNPTVMAPQPVSYPQYLPQQPVAPVPQYPSTPQVANDALSNYAKGGLLISAHKCGEDKIVFTSPQICDGPEYTVDKNGTFTQTGGGLSGGMNRVIVENCPVMQVIYNSWRSGLDIMG